MSTAQDICDWALRKNGISSPDSTERANALIDLNGILDTLSTKRFFIYAVTRETFSLVSGQASYTWGSGGNITTTRAMRISDMFIRDSSGYDFPVNEKTQIQYNDISDKDISTRPTKYYYATEYPLGIIYFNYAPTLTETVHVTSWKQLASFASLATTVVFPPGYERFLKLALTIEIAPDNDIELDPSIYANYDDAMSALENFNAQPVEPKKMPIEITRTPGNPFTDSNILTGE